MPVHHRATTAGHAHPRHSLPRWSRRLGTLVLAFAAALPSSAWDAGLMHAAAQRLGPRALAAVAPLQEVLATARAADDVERLGLINRFFNQRIGFRPDAEVWAVADHWTSPLEVLAKGQGDCEDYAIAKFASLRAAGVARERLRLVYVRARLPGQTEDQPHMVLAYQAEPGAEPLVLDNLRPEVLSAGQRPDLTPVFSFNDEGLWQGTGSTRAGNPLARLSRWREVWGRTLDEGFR
jgi:predicted transglutaminase-like cysteine proteinase